MATHQFKRDTVYLDPEAQRLSQETVVLPPIYRSIWRDDSGPHELPLIVRDTLNSWLNLLSAISDCELPKDSKALRNLLSINIQKFSEQPPADLAVKSVFNSCLECLKRCTGILNDYPDDPYPRSAPLEWSNRVAWLRAEICYAADFFGASSQNTLAPAVVNEQVRFYRHYFAEDARGIPKGWRMRIDPLGTLAAEVERSSEIRRVGARILALEDQCLGTRNPRLLDELKALRESYAKDAIKCLPEFKLPVLREHGAMFFRIAQFDARDTLPPLSLIDQIVQIEKSLLIDLNRDEPQEGFGRVVDRSEWLEYLSESGFKLFAITYRDKLCGFYSLTAVDDPPPRLKDSIDLVRSAGLLKRSNAWWVDNIGILKEASHELRSIGVPAYDLLTSAVVQTAQSFGVDQLFCEVRSGLRANLAEAKHKRREWSETGLTVMHGVTPYKILRHRPFSDRFAPLEERNLCSQVRL